MLNDSRAVFPNGIGALIVDSDERFLRSATLMLSLLNYRVATCERPTSVVKLITGRLKDADVVFIDALRAATCGFDFRRIVESHLCIPVVYFLSRDYGVAGDVAEALQRTVWAATYVVRKPLDAGDLSRLWRVIKWSKFLLRRAWPEWPARGSRVHPAVVGALLPSSSTVEGRWEDDDDDGREHFRVARAGRGRRRKQLGDRRHDVAGRSSGRGGGGVAAGPLEIGIRGQPPTERLEQMNLTGWQESDDDDVFPSHQQPAQQNRRGVQAMDVQNQQHGRPLFVQPVPHMLDVPRNNPMISADAAWPSSSNVAAFAGASNTTAPTLLRAYQAPARGARATSPAPHAVYSAQAPAAPGLRPPVYQQQQPVAPLYYFGDMVAPPPPAAVPTMAATSGHQPQFTLNHHHHQQQEMFAPRRQGGWMGCRRETGPVMLSFQQPPAADPFTPMAGSGSGTAFGASSPTGARDVGAYGAAAVAHLQSPNAGAQTAAADSFDDVLRAMMEMDYYANCGAEALMAPATDELAGTQAAALGSGNCSNYNAGSFMATDVNGGNSTPFMPPPDPAVPTGNQVQVELGAPDIYGSLVGSHQGGPSAMFNGGGDMAPMFPSDEYGENAMSFSLDALLDFGDDVPMYPEGQQVAAADSTTTTTNATGIMSNGGESGDLGPNWNMRAAAADEGLDMLEEFLMDDKVSDFLLLQDMDNGHQ